MEEVKTFSLLQVLRSIRTALEARFKGQYWVMAEMNRLNYYRQSGHCYPELVEKSGEKVVAQVRSIIWKNDFDRINLKFLEVLGEPLRDGIKVLFLCKIAFDPLHGLSLRIIDIDPSFTLGDLERQKAESIERLKKEGIFNLNRGKALSLIPSRIAVISVESSKGYADFNGILDKNPGGFKIKRTLFPSILQGDAAIQSILFQLNEISRSRNKFDAVAVIRGGGGDIGLSCYNNYMLAKAVAEFPLPVITGIGHATNETVVELVAHTNCITPTKVAEFILEKYRQFNNRINELSRALVNVTNRRFREENQFLNSEQKFLNLNSASILLTSNNVLAGMRSQIYHRSNFSIAQSRNMYNAFRSSFIRNSELLLSGNQKEIGSMPCKIKVVSHNILAGYDRLLTQEQRSVLNLHPGKVLKRGYAIVMKDQKILTGVASVKEGDSVITVMNDGAFINEVKVMQDKPGIFKSEL